MAALASPYPPHILPPPGSNPVWWPINAAQQAALHNPAQLLLYGGQSGGGKTDYLVGDAMQEMELPSFRGLLLRTTLQEMQQIEDRMDAVYTPLRARWRQRDKSWVFPAGGSVRLGYLAHDKHLAKYRGNPYSWLGVDESGFHPEKRIRQMVGWLASVDKRLRVRGRFTCNPGGIGIDWEMAMFLRGKCPVHFPAKPDDDNREKTSVYPNYVYKGAVWASDGSPVFKTTSFIPAAVGDNPLYGQDKIDSLLSQTAEIREQLLKGCWCNAEGLYYGFMRPDMVVPYPTVGDQWWWNHFISIDYGYANSSAAAGLYAIDPNGRGYKVGEIVEAKMDSVQFAKKIRDEWIRSMMPGSQRRRMSFITCDPANDAHTGTGKSNMDLMGEVFQEDGVGMIKSAKDPMGNAQNLYNALVNSRIVLTDAVPKAYASLSTRVVDERKAVKKIHGSPFDDIYDETSYGWNTWIERSEKPGRIEMLDRLEEMRRQGMDETSLLRNSWMLEQQEREREKLAERGIQLTRGGRIGNVRVQR